MVTTVSGTSVVEVEFVVLVVVSTTLVVVVVVVSASAGHAITSDMMIAIMVPITAIAILAIAMKKLLSNKFLFLIIAAPSTAWTPAYIFQCAFKHFNPTTIFEIYLKVLCGIGNM